MQKTTIGIGILSWKAHETLRKSLDSYRANGFLDCFDQKVIYFSDISTEDKAIASEYGWDYAGGPNEGIAGGMKHLAENIETDYILLLQNDNPIVEDVEFAKAYLDKVIALLQSGKADLARMRHRWQVGEGFADVAKYLKYYDVKNQSPDFIPMEHEIKTIPSWKKQLNRLLKPHNAKRFIGRSIYIEENPNEIYPQWIKRDGDILICDSAVLDFTDQCLLISRDTWLNVFVPFVEANPASTRSSNGFQAPELCINGPWWRDSHFKIAQGRGLFTHARYDGSFRSEHHTNTAYA